MVKIILNCEAAKTLSNFNACLRMGNFPYAWKQAELRFLPKPRKSGQTHIAYRPICLISSLGKVLERLVARGLKIHLAKVISKWQFGFLPGLSTTDAVRAVIASSQPNGNRDELIILITIDIKNAFNSVRWDKIVQALRRLRTPEYLIRMVKGYLYVMKIWVYL